jgi:hypothetical protein
MNQGKYNLNESIYIIVLGIGIFRQIISWAGMPDHWFSLFKKPI